MPLPELPRFAHVPGKTPAPDHQNLETAVAGWRGARPGSAGFEAGLDYGLRLLREGFFWEAHEVLEPIWQSLPPNSRERATARGLIQLANARLKLRMGRPRAALRLLDDAAAALAPVGGPCLGIDVPGLVGRLARDRDRLETGQPEEPWAVQRTCTKMPNPG